MPATVTPGNGGLSAYIKAAHDMLVGSASWRAYMIAGHSADLTGSSPLADFLNFVFQGDTVEDGLDYDDTEIQNDSDPATDEIRITDKMPFVVCYEEDDFAWTPVGQCAMTKFEIGGTVSFVFMDKVNRLGTDAPGLLDAKLRFANWIDNLIADWNTTVLPTTVQRIGLVGSIYRNRATSRPEEDYWMAKLSITFGPTTGGA